MEQTIEIRVKRSGLTRGKASLHIGDETGGLTVSNISVWEADGKLTIQMPLVQMDGGRRPAVTLQGALKQRVLEEIAAQFHAAR